MFMADHHNAVFNNTVENHLQPNLFLFRSMSIIEGAIQK
jgi:hypothetical protein